jgi:hypothetical protein
MRLLPRGARVGLKHKVTLFNFCRTQSGLKDTKRVELMSRMPENLPDRCRISANSSQHSVQVFCGFED